MLVIEKLNDCKIDDLPMRADESLCIDFLLDQLSKVEHCENLFLIESIFVYEKESSNYMILINRSIDGI